MYQRRSRRDRRRYACAVRCWAVSQTGPGAGGSSSYNAIAFPSSGRKKIKIKMLKEFLAEKLVPIILLDQK